jgi:hypothetical protein
MSRRRRGDDPWERRKMVPTDDLLGNLLPAAPEAGVWINAWRLPFWSIAEANELLISRRTDPLLCSHLSSRCCYIRGL